MENLNCQRTLHATLRTRSKVRRRTFLRLVFNNLSFKTRSSILQVRNTDPMRYYGLNKVKSIEPYYFWVKPTCELSDDPQEHRFLVAYLTDMTLASAANRPHSSLGYASSMVLSLDHTVHFHDFDYRADQWLLYENWSTWASHGRAFR